MFLLQESAGCASIINTDSKLEDWEETVSSIKVSSLCISADFICDYAEFWVIYYSSGC